MGKALRAHLAMSGDGHARLCPSYLGNLIGRNLLSPQSSALLIKWVLKAHKKKLDCRFYRDNLFTNKRIVLFGETIHNSSMKSMIHRNTIDKVSGFLVDAT
jgi:hypothetical protein